MSQRLDKVKLVKGRKWERMDPLDNVGVSTYALIKDAINEERTDLAQDLIDYLYFWELKFQRDANNDIVGGFPSFVMANYGEDGLFDVYHEVMMRSQGTTVWPRPPIKKRDVTNLEWTLDYAARMVGPHRMGRHDGTEGFMFEEYEDRYEISWDPCYSGGRARRGDPISNIPPHSAPPYNFAVSKVPHPWSWGKTGVSGYCIHCCILHEIMDTEQTGGYMQQWVCGYSENAWDPCKYIVYKELDWIPEEYYARIGKTKPASTSNKPAPKNPKLIKVSHSDELGTRFINVLPMLKKAVNKGDKEQALKLLDRLDAQMWIWAVQYPIRWNWAWIDLIVDKYGYNELYHILRSIPSWLEPPLAPGNPKAGKENIPSAEERVRKAALWGRGDRSGPDLSSVKIIDEPDKIVMELNPCGSVGYGLTLRDNVPDFIVDEIKNLNMHIYLTLPVTPLTEPPFNFKVTTERHPVAWNKIGIPHMCTRCCVQFEMGAVARTGYLTTIIERSENPKDPNCRWLFYKDVDDIPEKYYTRIGAKNRQLRKKPEIRTV